VPRASGPEFEYYVPEERAGDYPEGRYELALQTAVEQSNQEDVDALLARRSRPQTMRLALTILAASVAIALGTAFLSPNLPPPAPTTAKAAPAAVPRPELPAVEDCPRLGADERERLAGRLQDLGRRLKVQVPAGDTDADLAGALAAIDEHVPAARGKSGPHPASGARPALEA
jgi:hypothetical protein